MYLAHQNFTGFPSKKSNLMENFQSPFKQDELDPIVLVERGVSFLRTFGWILAVSSILGLALGLLFYFTTPKQYASRLILHSVVLTNQEEIEIIDTWKDLLRKGERSTLAHAMNTDISVIESLTKISGEEIQKLYVQNNPNGFMVDVLVKDTSVLDELQNGIVKGLESSDYVRERVASKKARLNEMIDKVKGEISKLDLTKNKVDQIITNNSGTASSMMIDVSGLNSQWVGLNEKLLGYQEELKFVNAVQVLQGFNKVSRPDKPNMFSSILFGVVGGFFIGYLFAIFKSLSRQLKRRSKAK